MVPAVPISVIPAVPAVQIPAVKQVLTVPAVLGRSGTKKIAKTVKNRTGTESSCIKMYAVPASGIPAVLAVPAVPIPAFF